MYTLEAALIFMNSAGCRGAKRQSLLVVLAVLLSSPECPGAACLPCGYYYCLLRNTMHVCDTAAGDVHLHRCRHCLHGHLVHPLTRSAEGCGPCVTHIS